MMTLKMKKIRLIIARADFEIVLRELINLGCVEITVPDDLLVDPELSSLVIREVFALDKFRTNLDSIVLLGTQHTLLLSGWIPARSELELTARLAKFICAWDIGPPEPDEHESIPVKMIWPGLFRVFYKGNGKLFNPLVSVAQNAEPNVEE